MITVTPVKPDQDQQIDKAENLLPSTAWVSFDIETGPLPDNFLRQLMPEFVPPPEPGEFDESSVKVGNLKDEAKILAKVLAARQAHAASVLSYQADVEQARLDQFATFKGTAALSATTGQVIAVGFAGPHGRIIKGQSRELSEIGLLKSLWTEVRLCLAESIPMLGHNIHGFDLPFCVQRSWLLGVPIPDGVITGGSGRKFWSPIFIDTMREWGFGNPQARIGLDELARAFGMDGKATADGEICGANFHEFWFSDDEERKRKAVEYVTRDVELPAKIAAKMGLI